MERQYLIFHGLALMFYVSLVSCAEDFHPKQNLNENEANLLNHVADPFGQGNVAGYGNSHQANAMDNNPQKKFQPNVELPPPDSLGAMGRHQPLNALNANPNFPSNFQNAHENVQAMGQQHFPQKALPNNVNANFQAPFIPNNPQNAVAQNHQPEDINLQQNYIGNQEPPQPRFANQQPLQLAGQVNQQAHLHQGFQAPQSNMGNHVVVQNEGAPPRVNVLPPGGKPPIQKDLGSIALSPSCAEDFKRICSGTNPINNFDVLFCLTNKQDNYGVSEACHQYIWDFKRNTTHDLRFETIAREICKQSLTLLNASQMHFHFRERFTDCAAYKAGENKLLSCLLDNKDAISAPLCVNFLTKVQTIMFSDYRLAIDVILASGIWIDGSPFGLIEDFVTDCKDDIQILKCGKIGTNELGKELTHSQGEVIECLERKYGEIGALTTSCRKQISRLAELSSDDFHLDRRLYFKCKHDREIFCGHVVAGQGMVYKCLFDRKFDQQMSRECSEALTGRQKLIAEDYKASYGLAHHCKVDIEKNRCAVQGSSDDDTISLATVMLCLEKQNINGVPISTACDDELIEYRQMIMEDYELSPEIVHECSAEIRDRCQNGLEKEGKTLHCLLGLAQEERGLNANCQKALLDLIKETAVEQDYRIDAVLTRACESVIQAKCSDLPEGDPMVLSCLMDNMNNVDMKKKCKDRMIELQYFVSRDFLVDPVFRDNCQEDAAIYCNAPHLQGGLARGDGEDYDAALPDEGNQLDPIPFSMVMSCLYRHIHSGMDDIDTDNVGGSLSPSCEEEVHRIIKQRALDFNLNPDLESNCRHELGEFCSERVHDKGSEFVCLQDNYEKMQSGLCKAEIRKLTKMESRNVEDFDSILVRECEPMLEKYCSDLLDDEDDGKIMECLIKNKEEMESAACAAGVTHFQLIEMKDFEFNYKFLLACKKDVDSFCDLSGIKQKIDVIKCLSTEVRNAIIGDKEPTVSFECRQQLTIENLQKHKNIELNPDMKLACSLDQKQYCLHVKSGKAQVIECLREHKPDLSPSCYKALFNFEASGMKRRIPTYSKAIYQHFNERKKRQNPEQDEVNNPKLDFQLMKNCKSDIKEHCLRSVLGGNPQLVVECLLKKKKLLLRSCRLVLTGREKEMFDDITLNPDLMSSCEEDIETLCEDAKDKAIEAHRDGIDPEGVVYKCLKEKFVSRSKGDELSLSCYRHVEFVVKEQGQNFELDPQLTIHCIRSIKTLCPPKEGKNVVECLKTKYFDKSLSNDLECMVEVARLLAEGESDIMVDPALHQACSTDLTKHCHRVPEGRGRLIACLTEAANRDKTSLTAECLDELEIRIGMWKVALNKPIQGIGELPNLIMESGHSSYIFSVLSLFIICVLLLGAVCGRLSKRVARERKTR